MDYIFYIVIASILAVMSLKVVKEYDRGVIFFLGKCTGVRGPGLIILIPFLERMTMVQLRTVTMDIPSQNHYKGQRFYRYCSRRVLSHR